MIAVDFFQKCSFGVLWYVEVCHGHNMGLACGRQCLCAPCREDRHVTVVVPLPTPMSVAFIGSVDSVLESFSSFFGKGF